MVDDPLSEEDKALFRAAAGKVKPLKNKEKIHSPLPKPALQAPRSARFVAEKQNKQQERFLSDFMLEEVSSNTLLSYCRPDFPKNRMQELKSGKIPRQARLDLHGFRGEDIALPLCRFIERNYALGNRCLLVIHGRGGHNNSPPIVKNRVNRYLPQFEEVLAFHSALARDGGLGAVYVLLKRLRD